MKNKPKRSENSRRSVTAKHHALECLPQKQGKTPKALAKPCPQGVVIDGSHYSGPEIRVFSHFRRYLMTPGDMLCLSAAEIETMSAGIDVLLDRQMLVSEGSHGAYCLTPNGFEVMMALPNKG